MYSRSAKGEEKGDSNRNLWLAKMRNRMQSLRQWNASRRHDSNTSKQIKSKTTDLPYIVSFTLRQPLNIKKITKNIDV